MPLSQALSNITFLNLIPWPLFFILLAALAAFVFFSYYQFSILTRRRVRLTLGLLRILLFLLILFMILDPYRDRSGNADWIGVLSIPLTA